VRDDDAAPAPAAEHRLLVVASDTMIAERARAALADDWRVLRCAPDEPGIRAALRVEAVDAVLIDVDESGSFGERQLDVVGRVVAAAAGAPVIVTTRATDSGETVRDIVRRGARDVCDTFVLEDELPSALERTRQAPAAGREPKPGGRGRLVVVIGALPGVGASTTALETGAVLADRTPGRRLLLVDLSRPHATAQALFPEARRYGIDDAVGDVGRLDAALVDGAFPRHADSGLRYLGPGDRGLDDPAPQPGDLLTLVELIRPLFDVTVVDADLAAAPQAARLLAAAADALVLCVDQRIAAVQAAARLLEAFAEGVADRSEIVICVTRYDGGSTPTAGDVARSLGTAGVVTVRDVGRAAVQAHNLGRFAACVSPRRRKAYRALADRIDAAGAPEIGPRPPRSAWRRVFGRAREGPA